MVNFLYGACDRNMSRKTREIWPGGDRVTGAGRSPYRVTGAGWQGWQGGRGDRVTGAGRLTGWQGHRESRLGTVIGNWPHGSCFHHSIPTEDGTILTWRMAGCISHSYMAVCVGRSAWGCLLIWGREDNMYTPALKGGTRLPKHVQNFVLGNPLVLAR